MIIKHVKINAISKKYKQHIIRINHVQLFEIRV